MSSGAGAVVAALLAALCAGSTDAADPERGYSGRLWGQTLVGRPTASDQGDTYYGEFRRAYGLASVVRAVERNDELVLMFANARTVGLRASGPILTPVALKQVRPGTFVGEMAVGVAPVSATRGGGPPPLITIMEDEILRVVAHRRTDRNGRGWIAGQAYSVPDRGLRGADTADAYRVAIRFRLRGDTVPTASP